VRAIELRISDLEAGRAQSEPLARVVPQWEPRPDIGLRIEPVWVSAQGDDEPGE
jgi:hypothetical protein